jgi:hypothetical protein
MLQDRMKLFGIVAVTAVATAGWMRQPQPIVTPVSAFTAPAEAMPEAVPVHSGVYHQAGEPVARSYPTGVRQTASRNRSSEPALRPDRARDVDYRPETVVQERSKTKSAAIIGGGAAAGAVIGGIAGGGKGAAIGALSGGAAGLVYDRMTHKKNVPAEEISRDNATYTDNGDRREGRSTAKSAAIIGGGAAAGAAVGAAAGGGKGAAIGALGGGAAGLIYDRMTKNR